MGLARGGGRGRGMVADLYDASAVSCEDEFALAPLVAHALVDRYSSDAVAVIAIANVLIKE